MVLWIFGIKFEVLNLVWSLIWSLVWVFGIEFALLEIGTECGNFNNIVHNGFP